MEIMEEFIISETEFQALASWASIISLVLSLISLYLIGSVRANVIASKRKARFRQLIHDINTIPNDAIPLSKASKSKLESLKRNLPNGYIPFFWSAKCKMIRYVNSAIDQENLENIKEGVDDYISLSEDL
ncbi:MAG: hypothetical protein HRU78_15070 [Gammaproteobacteria bacterium]|nr:MAG: hypothetical protein HRU78_15070 [Gammaproteobacteria bacterium]